MAQKRMFDKLVINSDSFLEMPDSSQNLYFHLSMSADDDGFVNNWKSIMRLTQKKEDDLKILIAKSFIIPFETGIIVIRHWKLNNYLRNDRYKETTFLKEKSQLMINDDQTYSLKSNEIGIPTVYPDKNRIEENSIDKNSKVFIKPTIQEIEEYCKERNNNVNPQKFYDYYEANNWKDGTGRPVKSWKQKMIANWEKENKTKSSIDKMEEVFKRFRESED